jgi:transposase
MLDEKTREAIFTLKRKGRGRKAIAKILSISRTTVRDVLRSGKSTVPKIERQDSTAPHVDLIRELYLECKGNWVRVHEELLAKKIEIPYSTLTAACRRYGIGVKEPRVSGSYDFPPGAEMQHDTSPHDAKIADQLRRLQCVSLWLGYSTMGFAQCYPTFNRFYCKVFLTDAFRFFGGACSRCTIDNTHVVILHGTGANAVVVPEMVAFAKRFGFTFIAHEIGDKNRSAGVERRFDYIENNFYPGRTFSSLPDLNQQLIQWCIDKNNLFRRHLQTKPVELFRLEKLHMRPLPLYIPEVYQLHMRVVDSYGYVNVHTNAYSVPCELVGKDVQVRESINTISIYHGHRLIATHERKEEGTHTRVTLPEHRYQRRSKHRKPNQPLIPEEKILRAGKTEFGTIVELFKEKRSNRAVRSIRALHRMYLEYPEEALLKALRDALEYGLIDIERIEQMVLKHIAGDFFRLPLAQKKGG